MEPEADRGAVCTRASIDVILKGPQPAVELERLSSDSCAKADRGRRYSAS